jgi:hypothetical protein
LSLSFLFKELNDKVSGCIHSNATPSRCRKRKFSP